MQLKETAFGYKLTTDGHSNSDWGAELGQGAKKLMNAEGFSEILNGMVYYKIDDINRITAPLGKGNKELNPLGDYADRTNIVLASLFERVKVNGENLVGEKFIMFITKDERKLNGNGGVNTHYQRRYLKFPDKAECDGISYNQNCIKAISNKLGCTPEGSWIVTDMNFIDDALCLTAFVIDSEKSYDFRDKIERSEKIKRIKFLEREKNFKPSTYEGDLAPIILYGPPGTGKTFKMQEEYISKFDKDNRFVTTFHQSFSYEEFVEGLKPILTNKDEENGDIKYKVAEGVFREACERAAELAGYDSFEKCIEDSFDNRQAKFTKAIEDKKLVLLCIDEINRGNVASIFGDLISLIEPSKRLGAKDEMTAILPYSKKEFGVPANLLIVGTMNTADRSIQLLDSALRRRFKFEELLPNYDVITNDEAKSVLKNINARVRCLLNKDNQIGHSYLMNAKNYCDILSALLNKIIPLLEEYFYNDIDKVRFVLDDTKSNLFYVEDSEAKKAYEAYMKDYDEERNYYQINPKIADAIKSKKEEECEKFLANILK